VSRQPRVALLVVRWAAALLPDPERRARYREQWEADVRGAGDLGLSPLRLALGAATAAARISTTAPSHRRAASGERITASSSKGSRMLPIGPLALAMRLVGGDVRRRTAALAALSALTLLGGLFLLVTG
jgi:hypothetical protein